MIVCFVFIYSSDGAIPVASAIEEDRRARADIAASFQVISPRILSFVSLILVFCAGKPAQCDLDFPLEDSLICWIAACGSITFRRKV